MQTWFASPAMGEAFLHLETDIDGEGSISYATSSIGEAAHVTEAASNAAEIAARRKHLAKRLNEHIKLFVAYVNALAIAIAGAAIIVPMVNAPDATLKRSGLAWFTASLALHCFGQAMIRLLRREE
ncbi:hypothetical protein DK419_18105 [Methylobacterium terrae]|uniref:Uncharacterized protein n=1 Tax=Methylobacterium terrae TaxID=2202827 RepID=A0A2U8WP12_9HYPH|nr:hypothetical protein [Methylobacterium terrae]AWN48005.1 hypothetical protein DK419_18105 [Methylobacterium terrae]